jgi:hypothetical protein
MGRGIPREVEWGIGLAFVVGMVILLVLAIAKFEGPTTTIMLVVAGVFLLVGVFFLSGTHKGAGTDADGGMGAGGSSQQQSVVIGGAGTPTTIRQGGGEILVACSGCGERVSESFNNCPHCGTKL